jgi:hypothetical protein
MLNPFWDDCHLVLITKLNFKKACSDGKIIEHLKVIFKVPLGQSVKKHIVPTSNNVLFSIYMSWLLKLLFYCFLHINALSYLIRL